jgi:hypothetical protein
MLGSDDQEWQPDDGCYQRYAVTDAICNFFTKPLLPHGASRVNRQISHFWLIRDIRQ